MLRLIRNRKGFTLIEVLLSLTILMMVLVPLSSLFITTAKVNTTSKERMIASQLAQEYMERIKGAANIEPFINGDFDNDNIMLYNVVKNGKHYILKTTITNTAVEYSKTIGQDLPDANLVIDQLTDNSTILIDINDVYINGTPNMCQLVTVQDIVIFIIFKEEKTITVANTSGKAVSIYLIKDASSADVNMSVNITEGNVKVVKNVFDSTIFNTDEKAGFVNWVYHITVEVYYDKNGLLTDDNKLIELKSLKRMN